MYRSGRLAVNRFSVLRRFLPETGDFLNIGCGAGEWVYLLRAAGRNAVGLELDPGYSNYAVRELGVPVTTGSVWDEEFSPERFAVISMFHVLEHLPEPVDCLSRCARWIRDGGNLIVEVPNISSIHQHPGKRFHPAHLFGFTPETVALAGECAGLFPVSVTVDKYERNIVAVFRKVPGGQATTLPLDVHRLEVPSVWAYYAMPQTYVRFAKRITQFTREWCATRHVTSGRALMQSIIAEAQISGPQGSGASAA